MSLHFNFGHKVRLQSIAKVARKLGLLPSEVELFGAYKAKIRLESLQRLYRRRRGKYILVTAMTPTPLGEGKTVTTIGLSMALNKLRKKAVACIRQPSLGPVFGIKGGAAGGGRAQVAPMDDFNLHFTGDTHAVGVAHNLCAAFLDNHLSRGDGFDIPLENVLWRRVIDISDRSLSNIEILGGRSGSGISRSSGFDITAASEVMAALALTDSLKDLHRRICRMVVAIDRQGRFVTCEDIKVAGAMAALLKDAIKPNLIQTIEHTPVLAHAGPFGNIAHGSSSILADRIALQLADYVITESGFGADLGAEKFFDIKCRASGLVPDAVVLVCSVRALKMHSGRFIVKPGIPLEQGLVSEDLEALRLGAPNLEKQIENVKFFGLPCVVAINRFPADTDREIAAVREIALRAGAYEALESTVFTEGSRGGVELAQAVMKAANARKNFNFLYPMELSVEEKMRTIAQKLYGAKDIEISALAREKIILYKTKGFDTLPVCMAKTHLSLSTDPSLKGRPRDFTVPIQDIRLSAGAGFLYALLGSIKTMPGLPSHPAGEKIDIDDSGTITGLF